jgi:hypothetical protein
MASAKICRNGNESTFRQTSMHHTPAQTNNTNNTNKLLRKQTFNHNTKLNKYKHHRLAIANRPGAR